MGTRISDMLRHMRRQAFVGREREIVLFRSLVQDAESPAVLLHVYGPGGQGKTTLLRHLEEWCDEVGLPAFRLDGRHLPAHPAAIWDALGDLAGADSTEHMLEKLEGAGPRVVLFIDTYEKLAPLDDWFRTEFLPQLPAGVRTVIAGRAAPSLAWQTDPGWKRLMAAAPLRNFSPEESRAYLDTQDVPAGQIPSILQFTYGHPLALSLVADIFTHQPDIVFSPDEAPGIVRSLLETFLQQIPGPAHRTALEIAALVHITTESVLAGIMEMESAGELFDWLRQLSFFDQNREGIYPHDIIREVLTADLRWRHPDYYQTLYERARNYFARRLQQVSAVEHRRTLFELLFLHRAHPMVRPYFDWEESGVQWVDGLLPADVPLLEVMIRANEGEESVTAFAFWREHPAARVWVWRDAQKRPEAFLLLIDAHELDPAEPVPDAAVRAVLDHGRRQFHLRGEEQLVLFRMWMAADTYQQVSPLQSSIFVAIVQYYFTPGLAVSLVACADPGFWRQMFTYAGMKEVAELRFSAGNRSIGWFMHDWRRQPITDWLAMLGKRGPAGALPEPMQRRSPEVLVLSEEAFAEAAADALKNYPDRDALMANPLIQSQLVVRHTGLEALVAVRITGLRKEIDRQLAEMEQSPADGKYHRVLYRTFINPVGSQERTAEFLRMSFSTYRRYLRAGTERLVERLWREECGGD